MNTIYANDVGLIKLGYQSENDRTEVIFDVSDLSAEFPGGLISVAVRRPTDSAGHLVTSITQNGSTARWLVDDYELEHRGIGELQLIYSVPNVVAKTKIWKTAVDRSLTVTDAIPPDWQDVANTLLDAASQVKAAVDSYDAMTAEATTLEPGSEATAEIDRSGEKPVLKIGIPKGHDAEVANIPVESGTGVGSAKTKDFEYKGTVYSNEASGRASFAEGMSTQATGTASHAEGAYTTASAKSSHAEGAYTFANGISSHAEGESTTAVNKCSHAEGEGTYAQGLRQHVQGTYNAVDTGTGVFADIVGNGSDNAHRSNAYALDWEGNGHYAGDVYVHANPDSTGGVKLTTVDDLPEAPVQDVQVAGVSVLQDGVANVPVASGTTAGAVIIDTQNQTGIQVLSGKLQLRPAVDGDIKAGWGGYKPLTAPKQHLSAFYGLAKAAGHDEKDSTLPVGQYTDEAKEAITKMLGLRLWHTAFLDINDYSSTLGMFVLDVGEGNEVEDIRMNGQIVWDTEFAGNSYFGIGVGNVPNRKHYTDFAQYSVSNSVNRVAIAAESHMIDPFGAYRCCMGYGYLGWSSNANHVLNVDILCNSLMNGLQTCAYHDFNNPRYVHVVAPDNPSWALIKVEYTLK